MLTHLSTFSGMGGSSQGVKQTGEYKTIGAVEISTNAADVYAMNHPATTIYRGDIRKLELVDLGIGIGELDLLEGSPPCSNFSMSGNREDSWGKVTSGDSAVDQQNVEDLFFDFLALAAKTQPRALIAENVPAMLSGLAKGYVKEIVAQLETMGYQVRAAVLNSMEYSVPQERRRLFFVAFRGDVDSTGYQWPAPTSTGQEMSLGVQFPWIDTFIATLPFKPMIKNQYQIKEVPKQRPVPTVLSNGLGGVSMSSNAAIYNDSQPDPADPLDRHPEVVNTRLMGRTYKRRTGLDCCWLGIDDLKRVMSFAPDYKMTGLYSHRWQRVGNAVPPNLMQAVSQSVADCLNG